MPHLFEPVLAVSRPALRNSSSVPALQSLHDSFGPSLQRSDTSADFVDPDRIMDEECDQEVSTTTVLMPAHAEMSTQSTARICPAYYESTNANPFSFARSAHCAPEDWKSSARFASCTPKGLHGYNNQDMPQPPTLPQYSTLVLTGRPAHQQPPIPYESHGVVAPQVSAAPAPYVQHNPYSTHQPYVHTHNSDLYTHADVAPFSFEHPFLVRPRNVRGKHPISAPIASEAPKSSLTVHNPYSFTPTIYTPVELPESPTSSRPTSPTSSNDSTQFTAHDCPSFDAANTISSHSSTASLNSGWSNSEPTHVQETTNLVYPTATMPPAFAVGQYYCRPPVVSMPPPQICGPYCGQHQQQGYPTCNVAPAPAYYGYDYCASYQQNSQYLCVPSPKMSGDASSHSGSENGISDDGRSVLSSSTLHNSSRSIISGIEESTATSILGTEGAKKKRYRARCPTCSTTPDVKRLRFKRGFTYFVCLRCHFKWRLQGAK